MDVGGWQQVSLGRVVVQGERDTLALDVVLSFDAIGFADVMDEQVLVAWNFWRCSID